METVSGGFLQDGQKAGPGLRVGVLRCALAGAIAVASLAATSQAGAQVPPPPPPPPGTNPDPNAPPPAPPPETVPPPAPETTTPTPPVTPTPPATPVPPVASPEPAADTTAPILSRPELSRARFSRTGAGTKVSFTLSEPALVKFKLYQRKTGRRVDGRCVKPKRSNSTALKCTRSVGRGVFFFPGKAGENSFRLKARFDGRRLAAGRYRLVAIARDPAGNISASKSRRLRITGSTRASNPTAHQSGYNQWTFWYWYRGRTYVGETWDVYWLWSSQQQTWYAAQVEYRCLITCERASGHYWWAIYRNGQWVGWYDACSPGYVCVFRNARASDARALRRRAGRS
jgi:hypothetical protein